MTRFYALTWVLQRVTGALLLFFLTFHLWLSHYFDTENFFYRILLHDLPPYGWNILRFLFLITIIFHGGNGLYTVLSSFIKRGKALSLIAFSIIILAFMAAAISWKFVF
jgi:succinate dehydrogenase hydrophobic anchor subunit